MGVETGGLGQFVLTGSPSTVISVGPSSLVMLEMVILFLASLSMTLHM